MRGRLIDERVFDELSQMPRSRRLVLVTSLARRAARRRGVVISTTLWAGASIVLALVLFVLLGFGVDWGWYAGWPRPLVALMVLGTPLAVPVLTYPLLSAYTTPRLRLLMHEMLTSRRGKPFVCLVCGYWLIGARYRGPAAKCPECGEPVPSRHPRQRTLPRWRGLARRLTDPGGLRFGRRASHTAVPAEAALSRRWDYPKSTGKAKLS